MKTKREVSAVGGVRLIVRGPDGFPVEIVLLERRAVRDRVDQGLSENHVCLVSAQSRFPTGFPVQKRRVLGGLAGRSADTGGKQVFADTAEAAASILSPWPARHPR